jgi:hypothetical protein
VDHRAGLDIVVKRKIEVITPVLYGILEIEAAGSSETSVLTLRTTRCQNPKENTALKTSSHIKYFMFIPLFNSVLFFISNFVLHYVRFFMCISVYKLKIP